MTVLIYKCHPDASLPRRAENEAAGYDVCALEDFWIRPGERVVIRTGLVIMPPAGYHTEVLVRSSMAYKHGIMLTNSVGLIDRSFASKEDELKIMLYRVPNSTSDSLHIAKGDRVAQLVFRKTEVFEIQEVDQAPKDITRGGLGSTGK